MRISADSEPRGRCSERARVTDSKRYACRCSRHCYGGTRRVRRVTSSSSSNVHVLGWMEVLSKRKKGRSQLSAPCPRAATLFGTPNAEHRAPHIRYSRRVSSLLRFSSPSMLTSLSRRQAHRTRLAQSWVQQRAFDCCTAIFGSGRRSGPWHSPRTRRVGVLSGCFHCSDFLIIAHHKCDSYRPMSRE